MIDQFPLVTEKTRVCKKCGESYTTKTCRPCKNAYMRAWSKANPEKIKASNLAYGAANREAVAAKAKAWYYANPERAKAQRSEWRKANPEKVKIANQLSYSLHKDHLAAVSRAWAKAHPDVGRRNVRNRRARMAGAGGVLSKDIAAKLLALQKGLCACCKISLKKSGHHLDHIAPIATGGQNVDSNIQLLCPSCNFSKSAKHPIEFMQSRGYLL